MAKDCSRRLDDGSFVIHYDPAIVGQFDPSATVPSIWPAFQVLKCRLMLVRGVNTDVLPEPVADKMRETQPDMEYLQVADCGHAPGLHMPRQVIPVVGFLTAS